jgi:outer membrane protein TolC
MKWFPIGILILILPLEAPVFAQPAPGDSAPGGEPLRLTLERAVELALGQSLSLRKASIDLATQRIQAENLWSQMFPGISLSGGLGYGSQTYPDPAFQLSYSAAVELSLPLRPTLPGAMKVIELTYRAQLLSYESARKQLSITVAQSYYRLIRDRQNLKNLEDLRDLAVRQAEQNQARFNNGTLSQVVFLQSRLSAEEARFTLSQAETAYVSALGTFLVSLGLDQYRGVVLEGEIEIDRIEADPERLIAGYLPKHPDIVGKRQNIERLEQVRKNTALDTLFPATVTLSAGLGGSGTAPGSGAAAQSGSTWNTSMPLSGSLKVSIPLNPWIPGTDENQKVRSARAEVEKARLELADAENQAKLRIRTLTENLRNSWTAVEIARLRLEIAERAYELSEQGFQNGTIDSLSLVNSRNSMAQARQALLGEEYSYLSMILDLQAELNIDWNELRNL